MTTSFEQSEHEKIMMEISKLRDETSRLNDSSRWYECIASAAGTIAIIWLVKTFL